MKTQTNPGHISQTVDGRPGTTAHGRGLAAAVVAFAVLLGACGDSDASSTSATINISPPGLDERANSSSGRSSSTPGTNSATTSASRSDSGQPTTTAAPADTVTGSRDDAEVPTAVGDFERSSQDATSTFALDVDTASLSVSRNLITSGRLPSTNLVRV